MSERVVDEMEMRDMNPKEQKNRSIALRGAIGRLKKRRGSRGLTLVELVIVITLIGILTAAIAVGVFKLNADAKVGIAKTACTSLRSATLSYMGSHVGADCPTPETLKKEKALDETFDINDPWGKPYKIECDGEDSIRARSSGPDKTEGNEDDVSMPKK